MTSDAYDMWFNGIGVALANPDYHCTNLSLGICVT